MTDFCPTCRLDWNLHTERAAQRCYRLWRLSARKFAIPYRLPDIEPSSSWRVPYRQLVAA